MGSEPALKVLVGTNQKNERQARAGLAALGIPDEGLLEARREEIRGLVRSIEAQGVSAQLCALSWPRDEYIYHKGKFFEKSRCGNWGIGGAILPAEDYILVPDTLPEVLNKTPEETAQRACEGFGVARCHVLPAHRGNNHLDLYVLNLPELGVVVFDEDYYAEHTAALEDFVNTEGLVVKTVDNPQVSIDGVCVAPSYPTNALTVRDEGEELLVFTALCDGGSPLIRTLADFDARVIEVPFARYCSSNGSVRCMTNYLPIDYQHPAAVS